MSGPIDRPVRRAVLVLILALAAASGALAGAGLAVAPHAHPPGTPLVHDHLLAAYRYPLFLVRLRALAAAAAGPHWSLDRPADGAAAVITFATLIAIVPRLPRPTRRLVETFAAPALARPVWSAALILAPPRAETLLSA